MAKDSSSLTSSGNTDHSGNRKLSLDKPSIGRWKPSLTMAECDAILTQPGQMLETELEVVDGRVMRVYKNLWPVSLFVGLG